MTDRNLLFLNMTVNDKNQTIDVCLVEKQQIPVYSFWFDTIRTGTNDLRTWGVHANNYTSDGDAVHTIYRTWGVHA